MSKLEHKAILASAGSGKTFQLAHRYIRILSGKDADGKLVTPDRICAMTFTRKAAGEIFDSIANYLRVSASDESNAAITSQRIDMPQMKRADYLMTLRRFIDNLHCARIGTLDSFIVGIAKAFPVELGIPMDFQVMDTSGAAAQENRERVLDRILHYTDSGNLGRTFVESFRQATYGHEEKKLGKAVDTFLTRMRSQYRLCSDGSKWGNDKVIWGDNRPFAQPVRFDSADAVKEVRAWYDSQDLTQSRPKAVYDFVLSVAEELADYGHTSSANNLMDKSLFGQFLGQLNQMKQGDAALEYYNVKYTIPHKIASVLAALIHNMICIEYQRMLNRTAGLFNLLSTYDREYEDITRALGMFSFTDIQYLLAGGKAISRKEAPDRLYIDYRMDCRLDHWLLDEFQDTSDLQWAVFENLISEIVQAGDAEARSFFYVGDVKQAIYSWRGGNHELFLDIINKFNENGKVINIQPMQETYRCSEPVIRAVNKVFTSLPIEFPRTTVDKWSGVWKEHKTVSESKDTGYVTILEPELSQDSDVSPEEQRCQLVADLLNEIQPLKRGLKVGVLVRGNDFGKELVNLLSKECPEMNFVHEGESSIGENEVAALLINMVKAAAHPGDEYAWKYIQMTPMSEVLRGKGVNRSNMSGLLMSEIQEEGYQTFVRNWGDLLAGALAIQGRDIGEYGQECLDRIETAAAEFDALGQPDCDSFLRYMDSYTTREQPSSSAVRVMTIHQSKGLEFDIVILAELQTRKESNMIQTSASDLICAGARSNPDWILKMPKRILAEMDPVLNAQLEAANAAHSFDSLCGVYVAMTRARSGLYILTSGFKSSPKTMHASVFIKQQLTGEGNSPKAKANINLSGRDYKKLYEDGGGSGWYEKKWPIRDEAVVEEDALHLAEGYAKTIDKVKVLKHREPSRLRTIMVRPASTLFEARSAEIMHFGSAIHEMFEQVEWAEDADVDAIVSTWEPTSAYEVEVTKDAIEQFRNCMKSDAIRSCLSNPTNAVQKSSQRPQVSHQNAEVWLEKSFEIVLDDEFVSGAFDRVVIVRDEQGKPVSAAIFDYKSSMVDESGIDEKVKDYIPQMHTYRDALSVILALDKKKIMLNLIFTKQQALRTV